MITPGTNAGSRSGRKSTLAISLQPFRLWVGCHITSLLQAIEAFIASWNQNAAPFEWTKQEVNQQEMKRSYADLCN